MHKRSAIWALRMLWDPRFLLGFSAYWALSEFVYMRNVVFGVVAVLCFVINALRAALEDEARPRMEAPTVVALRRGWNEYEEGRDDA